MSDESVPSPETSKQAMEYLHEHNTHTSKVDEKGRMKPGCVKQKHTVLKREYFHYAFGEIDRKGALACGDTFTGTQKHYRFIGGDGYTLCGWLACDCANCLQFDHANCTEKKETNLMTRVAGERWPHTHAEAAAREGTPGLYKHTYTVRDREAELKAAQRRRGRGSRLETQQKRVVAKKRFVLLEESKEDPSVAVPVLCRCEMVGEDDVIVYNRCREVAAPDGEGQSPTYVLELELEMVARNKVLPPVGFGMRKAPTGGVEGVEWWKLTGRNLQLVQQTVADVGAGIL